MTNQNLPNNIRLGAAAKAAPHVHPRLAAVEVSGDTEPARLVVEIRDLTRRDSTRRASAS